MGTELTPGDLASTLDELEQLLRGADEPRWAQSMARFRARLDQGEALPDVAADVLGVYGGMGSFSDVVLQDARGVRPEQPGFDAARRSLHQQATELRA